MILVCVCDIRHKWACFWNLFTALYSHINMHECTFVTTHPTRISTSLLFAFLFWLLSAMMAFHACSCCRRSISVASNPALAASNLSCACCGLNSGHAGRHGSIMRATLYIVFKMENMMRKITNGMNIATNIKNISHPRKQPWTTDTIDIFSLLSVQQPHINASGKQSSPNTMPSAAAGIKKIHAHTTRTAINQRGGASPSIPSNCLPLHGPSSL